ncbi:aminotransferase class III-fold pyridoxal phosphate-dependent enzyme [Streptacidiphilus sp. PB12-B1b]|uniref:aminotransferase class III-fold pyridoxal phosphate-dependent enzyme n=1 Tax=Streptacidiphilus sp. PB12-B1b TaxID=2705012 RepID=UPI0015FDCB48|nr:aminotransferase class III-fold pyridoxal phosphate-dependent enzyme [Streptacidiphilus sp. PB12-B1b]QMU78301.1 aminotransferase class III-fold pyridoxal phosphate-dependent enzyme [Streptacidiphilus sp. PB12-B1b]
MSAPAASRLAESELTLLRRSQELHFNHYERTPLPFASLGAQGIVIDALALSPEGDGQGESLRLLDASGGYASACLGAGHPVVAESVRRAVLDAGYVTDEIASLARARLLDRLFGPQGLFTDHFPYGEYHVAGRNSGSEGMELAVRLLLESRFDPRRLRPRPGREQRDTILAFEGAWHGWTQGLLPFLNRRHYRVGLPGPEADGPYGVRVVHIPFAAPEALAEFFAENGGRLLGVVVEPIQGDAGILVPPPGYLRTLARLCTEHEALLVADEVLTFAKSGRFFAMADEDGPVPTDVTVIGKSLGMGVVSTSMVIARRALRARSSGTVATSDLRPVTCQVVQDGLEHIVAAGLVDRSARFGEELAVRLRTELVEAFPRTFTRTRGRGVMHGLELSDAAAARLDKLRTEVIRAGVYTEFMAGAGRRSRGLRYVHPTMRIAPPLITTDDEAADIVARIAEGTKRFEAGL